MSYKLYADDRCVEEIFSPNDLREKAGYEKVNNKEKKKICNCPNCGAPISSYICEYCGTKFEKPKKNVTDQEKRDSFAEFVREQQKAQIPYYQEWQRRNILNALNTYSDDCMSITNHQLSPYQGPKVQEKPKEEKEGKNSR